MIPTLFPVLCTLLLFMTHGAARYPKADPLLDSKISLDLLEVWKTAAEYAVVGYCSKTKVEAWDCGLRCSGRNKNTIIRKFFDIPDTQTGGFIGYHQEHKVIIVTYRGTNGNQAWLNNISLNTKRWPTNPDSSYRVHRGFLKMFKPSEKIVFEEVMSLLQRFPDYTIMFTGTSLGAALATLATVAFREKLQETPNLWRGNDHLSYQNIHDIKTTLVSFGSPRVGNAAWARYAYDLLQRHQVPHYRIVNKGDPVPHLIPHTLGYRHLPMEVWIGEPDYFPILCDRDNGEDNTCSNSLPFWWLRKSDHLSVWDISLRGLEPGCRHDEHPLVTNNK